ncbi:MAG TPA: GNAT family N-acetyltransferase [Flavipsychrobacter sp.]|nr:GNAT family N-acetyltransferase [Flavipsychrobacter sp.]
MTITHNPEQNRFETVVEGETAHVDYILHDDSIALTHTIVPDKIGRRGIATELVKYAFEYAKEHGLAVKPYCSFVVAFLNKHESYQEQLKLNRP